MASYNHQEFKTQYPDFYSDMISVFLAEYSVQEMNDFLDEAEFVVGVVGDDVKVHYKNGVTDRFMIQIKKKLIHDVGYHFRQSDDISR